MAEDGSTSDPPPTDHNVPVVDYRAPGAVEAIGALRYAWQRIPIAGRWAALIALCLPIGLFLSTGKDGYSSVLVPVVWIAGAMYVGTRIIQSHAADPIRLIKLLAAVPAALLAPFLLCEDSLGNWPLGVLHSYGWNSRALGTGGRVAFGMFITLLSVVAIADIAAAMKHFRRQRSKPQL